MAEAFSYDVFISYSRRDRAWVRKVLLPRLEATGLRVCIDFRDFRVGVFSLQEIDRAILESRKTLIVLTPAYLESEWAGLEATIVQTMDPANQRHRLVPVLRRRCTLPGRLQALTYVDFTVKDNEEFAWGRLLEALGAPDAASARPQSPEIPVRAPLSGDECLSWPSLLVVNLAVIAGLALLLNWTKLSVPCVPRLVSAFGVSVLTVSWGQVLWRHSRAVLTSAGGSIAGFSFPLRALSAVHLCRLPTRWLWVVAGSLSAAILALFLFPPWTDETSTPVNGFSVTHSNSAAVHLSPGGVAEVRSGDSVIVAAQVQEAAGARCQWFAGRGRLAERAECSTVYVAPLSGNFDSLSILVESRCQARSSFAGLSIKVVPLQP